MKSIRKILQSRENTALPLHQHMDNRAPPPHMNSLAIVSMQNTLAVFGLSMV